MNYIKKIALFYFVAALFLGVFATAVKASDMPPIGTIVYENNDYVWLIDGDTKEKTKIGAGNFPALSDTMGTTPELAKNEVAYILTEENSHFKASNKEGIYIYNIATGKKKYVKYGVSDVINQVMWSPNGKFLFVGTHTSTFDTKTLITRKGKKKMSFKTVGNQFMWLLGDDNGTATLENKILYTSLHSVTPARPTGVGGESGLGVSFKNFSGKTKKVLKKPTALVDYRLFGLDMDKIQYIKYKVSAQDDWSHNAKIKKRYRTMNINGKNAQKTNKLVTNAVQIAKALPKKYKDYSVIDYGAPIWNIDFRLFVLDPDAETSGDEAIYVMQLPDKETLTKIVNGNNPSWGWSLN
ncbi:MAG: hypothetical protein ABID45_03955 [Patescibacteria group bacterium]